MYSTTEEHHYYTSLQQQWSNLLLHGSDTLYYIMILHCTVNAIFFLSNKLYIIVWWLVYIIYTWI